MPGAHTRTRPLPANDCSVSDEESKLELYLQKQLEDDVARIFDESIYTDLEVVCGKLKILTHSCILKARTNKFYHKLQTILHANISRDNFDEIYSFVSDAYTECNINHQEEEIIDYLNRLTVFKPVQNSIVNEKSGLEEKDVFVTPTCDISPCLDNAFKNFTCPITGLTKEYYALVPIEGNILEKELIEQDAISNAFQSLNKVKVKPFNKPNSLSLSEITSSQISKLVKHSNSCDSLINRKNKSSIGEEDKKENLVPSETCKTTGKADIQEKEIDSTYTPDSLIIDDSSSSDYLSAAYTFSPGVSTSGPQTLNVGDTKKMEQNVISSDSGLDNTGLLESLNSHKDITLTDVSLTESTLHDLVADDVNDSITSLSLAEKNQQERFPHVTSTASLSSTSVERDSGQKATQISIIRKDSIASKSSKEEKQRLNEEIVILESSSLSSETGSWESVFPPKVDAKNICQKFITKERQCCNFVGVKNDSANQEEDYCPSLVQRSPFKSTSCFIDASSLVDEEDASKIQIDGVAGTESINSHAPSQPILCSTVRPDISPSDWSEGNENDDSLEQPDNKNPDSVQKDLSPTIFDMTPITEDSLYTNPFEEGEHTDSELRKNTEMTGHSSYFIEKESSIPTNTVYFSSTPNNSIMSLEGSELQQLRCQENETDRTSVRECYPQLKILKKFNEASPIVSGGASVEDHLPQMSSNTGSPLTRRKIENMPIVSGAYVPEVQDKSSLDTRPSRLCNTSAWVVDMSSSTTIKKLGDRPCNVIKNDSKCGTLESNNKSRSSVDSDLSEKSSQKFYIDLSTLPNPLPPKMDIISESTEKRNIFSMYIDFSDKSKPKEMPSRLSSKKSNMIIEPKTMSKTKFEKASNQITAPNGNIKNTFEEYESLCNDPNIPVSDIIERIGVQKKPFNSFSSNQSKKVVQNVEEKNKPKDKPSDYSLRELPSLTNNEALMDTQGESFVKLSDLDKPIQKPESSLVAKVSDVRMTRSIPDTNWGEKNAVSRSIDVITSFHSENALSLNRLFPHLKDEFSKSMPGSLSARTRSPLRLGAAASPNEKDELTSDNIMSEISSVQSSVCRSVIENSTTEEASQTSSLIGNCQSRLGQDLLRMFLEEIAPDVIVEVSGKRIKAHKCILSSRCQYFAGILSGGWVESAGNVIVLPPFSFNVVHFALCHIYSGVSTIPDSISIVELATIADMLGLEGLKEAIMFTLKSKYCHHFHRPCPVCTAGVLECFPLSSVYGLEDLYRKCLRWITKYFHKVWPTKAFATLPKELLDKCYQQHIVNLNTDNLIDTVYGCGITVASLQNSRWAEVVARMCRRLVSAAAQFAAARLSGVLRALAAVPADTPSPPQPARQALDDCFAAAIEWAPPEEACRTYAFLSALLRRPENDGSHIKPPLNSLFSAHASGWRLQCENALVRAAPRVVATQAFKDLPSDLRKRLRELGCIMYGTQTLPTVSTSVFDKKSRYVNKANKSGTAVTRSLDIDHVRTSFVPYTSKPSLPIGSNEIFKSNNDVTDRRANRSHPPKIRTTKAQEERAKYNFTKNNQSQEKCNGKAAKTRLSHESTKPRYLEPKLCKESVRQTPKKIVPKVVSSSESSRNSRSPIQARGVRVSRSKAGEGRTPAPAAAALSQDSLSTCSRPRTAEPSTESLSESQNSNKYATYTKTRHTNKGSIDSVSSPKGPTYHQITPNNKMKTKIPVYSNHVKKTEYVDKEQSVESLQVNKMATNNSNVYRKSHRNGSLMSATKSSSAKMVPKIVRDSPNKSPRSVRATKHTQGSAAGNRAPQPPPPPPPDIPVMERSGTFLKDEPMFGDKTMNIDIDQPTVYNSHDEKNV